MSREGWSDEVAAMVARGARGSEQEIRAVVDFLADHFSR
jgi:hypothetical protein